MARWSLLRQVVAPGQEAQLDAVAPEGMAVGAPAVVPYSAVAVVAHRLPAVRARAWASLYWQARASAQPVAEMDSRRLA